MWPGAIREALDPTAAGSVLGDGVGPEGETVCLTPPKGDQGNQGSALAYLGVTETHPGTIGGAKEGPSWYSAPGNLACCADLRHPPVEGTSVHKHFRSGHFGSWLFPTDGTDDWAWSQAEHWPFHTAREGTDSSAPGDKG